MLAALSIILPVLFYITIMGTTTKIKVLAIKLYVYYVLSFPFFSHVCVSTSIILFPLIPKANSLAEGFFEALSAGYHMRARWWGVWDLVRRLIFIVILVALPGRTVSITWKILTGFLCYSLTSSLQHKVQPLFL